MFLKMQLTNGKCSKNNKNKANINISDDVLMKYFEQGYNNNNLWIPKAIREKKIEKLKAQNKWIFEFLTPLKNNAELTDDTLKFLLCYNKFDNVSSSKLS